MEHCLSLNKCPNLVAFVKPFGF